MSYFKYILKGFKNNISRLLAIIAIITLGIGFLVGLTTSSTDVRTSVDVMYSNTNVMDFNLKSTIGFSKETVNRLDSKNDMDAIGVFQLEAKESFLNTVKVKSRLISSDLKNQRINKLELVDGRMPEAQNECVVLKDMDVYHKAKIGDKIIVKDDKMNIDRTYDVVGIVKSPLYFAKDKEYNLTGTNRLDLLFFVDNNYEDFDLITDIYVRTNVKEDRFSNGYFDSLKKFEDELKNNENDIISERRNEIKGDIKKEIIDTKLDEIKDSVNSSIKDEIRKQILEPTNYEKLKNEVNKQIKSQIRENILKPENFSIIEKEVHDKTVAEVKASIEADPSKKSELEAAVKDSAIKNLVENYESIPEMAPYLEMINAMVANALLEQATKELEEAGNAAPTDEEKLAYMETMPEAQKEEIKNQTLYNLGVIGWDSNMIFTQEIKDAAYKEGLNQAGEAYYLSVKDELLDKALNEAANKAYSNMSEADFKKAYDEALNRAVLKGFDEMSDDDKNKAYNEAIDTIVDLAYDEFLNNGSTTKDPKLASYELNSEGSNNDFEKVYVLNLKTNQSYVSVRENAKKIDNIAVIFPVFFYFIAALVALTTITRLVNEERGIIGLFKSLGFSKFKILSKYLLFALVCSVLGSALGNLAGVYALPYVVYGAYKTILDLPPMVFTVEAMINCISIVMMIITIMGVASYVTLQTLKERPAELLQPKAPKPGKRLLLERWKGLWKRIKFKYKNTLRNIFRYKKNLAMMMVGVGGCVALLVTAFGIRDAFDTLATVQYDKILSYDLRVNVDDGTYLPDDILNECEYRYVNQKSVYIDGDDDYQINRITTKSDMNSYFSFKHGGKKVEFNPGDVVIDMQIAKAFDLKVGSTFKFDDSKKEYTVTGIFDNHIDNYIFVYDSELSDSECNTYFINLNDGVNEEKILDDLGLNNVLGIESISQKKKSFDTMLSSVVLILVVVIICSGALAIIVIYNLTNININERLKEIATLKVLGYQNREVYGYIYREIFVLTIFGILLGFLVGPFLYKFVMLNLNEPGMMLPTSVHPLNYLYSFLFTLLFTFIVDLILVRKIKNIKMVESLKCVD